MQIFGSSGVRGVANQELTPRYALSIAQAAGSVLGSARVSLARDPRTSGPMFADAVTSGLESVGASVDRLGCCPTPALQAYCEATGQPGVMITASHNPPEYNGLKLVGADGVELTRDRLEQVETALDSGVGLAAWEGVGDSRMIDGGLRRYREQLHGAVDERTLPDDLTVAIDPGHGAASQVSPRVFRDLGWTVKTVNAQTDGRFPGRDPEPVADNLGALARLVRTSDADVGIAHDGDGDRAIFFDETGGFIEGDAALAALAADRLRPDDVAVSAVNASQRLVDVVNAAGATLRLTPIGSTNLITEIRTQRDQGKRIPIAGEGNGGIIFPDYRIARDGVFTAVRFCALLEDEPASELVAAFDAYENVRRNIPYSSEAERATMLEAVEQAARDAPAELDTTDGYRLDYGDGWVLARPSGTEPVIRVYAEARDAERARKLAESMTAQIGTE